MDMVCPNFNFLGKIGLPVKTFLFSILQFPRLTITLLMTMSFSNDFILTFTYLM